MDNRKLITGTKAKIVPLNDICPPITEKKVANAILAGKLIEPKINEALPNILSIFFIYLHFFYSSLINPNI